MGIFSFLHSSRKQGANDSNGNGLILYQYYNSFYSQKVVFALLEKKLEFKSQIVDIGKGEQFQPWYLKLNPEAQVPVLKDGVKIIPDSSRIIDYLEDNFSNGAPRLLPDKGSEQWQKVKEFTELFDSFPASGLTFGAAFFPDISVNPKMTQTERNHRKQILVSRQLLLQELSALYPEFKVCYDAKRASLTKLLSAVENEENLHQSLKTLERTLDSCESELVSHVEGKSDWWLCSEQFSLADISLAVILRRISHLGFYEPYISADLRPCLHKYFQRIQKRDSFIKVYNQGNEQTLNKCSCQEYISMAIGATAIVGFVAGVMIVYKRSK